MDQSSKVSLSAVLGFILIAIAVIPVRAAVILPNLPAGSQYQLVFVTADGRNASSSNIADYNSFVTQEAALNSSLPATTWHAIASTPTVNAINNASTSASIPIYNTHGQLVANGTSDFWYPVHTNLIDYDQYGFMNSQYVWTGTNPNGTANSPLGMTNAILGFSTDATASHWTFFSQGGTSGAEEFYALSAPITAPEPSGLFGLAIAAVAIFPCRVAKRV